MSQPWITQVAVSGSDSEPESENCSAHENIICYYVYYTYYTCYSVSFIHSPIWIMSSSAAE